MPSKIIIITTHARDRFTERFPDLDITIETAFAKAVPYGVKTKFTKNFINLDLNVVFVVDTKSSDDILVTILTTDLYNANIQATSLGRNIQLDFNKPVEQQVKIKQQVKQSVEQLPPVDIKARAINYAIETDFYPKGTKLPMGISKRKSQLFWEEYYKYKRFVLTAEAGFYPMRIQLVTYDNMIMLCNKPEDIPINDTFAIIELKVKEYDESRRERVSCGNEG